MTGVQTCALPIWGLALGRRRWLRAPDLRSLLAAGQRLRGRVRAPDLRSLPCQGEQQDRDVLNGAGGLVQGLLSGVPAQGQELGHPCPVAGQGGTDDQVVLTKEKGTDGRVWLKGGEVVHRPRVPHEA